MPRPPLALLLELERDILRRISGGSDLASALSGLVLAAARMLPGGICSIWILDPVKATLELVAQAPSDPAPAATSIPVTAISGLDAAVPGEALAITDSDLLGGPATAMPVVGFDGKLLGLLCNRAAQGETSSIRDILAFAAHTASVAVERFHVVQALRDREADLARVQQIGRVGGVEVDLRSGFQNRRSPEYLAIHGLPPSAVNETHEAWVQRIHPDDRERTEQQFKDAVKQGVTDYTAEYRIIRPSDGELRWIAVKARIERTPDGAPLRLVGAHIDVTDRMLAQERLRESEGRFRLIANSAPVPVWVSKLNGQREFVNQAYLDFLGKNFDEALVFDWRKILHPDDLPRILQEQIAGESSRKPFALEARYRRADGEWRWIRSESQPRWDEMGRHVGFIGVAHDITAAKEALLQSEAQFKLLVEGVVDYAIYLLSPEGNVTSWNTGAERIKGYKPIEIIGQHFSRFYTPEDQRAGEPTRALETAKREGKYEKEAQRMRKDGTRFWANVVIDPIRDGDGSILGFAKVTRDITERKEAERELEKARDDLFQSQKMDAVGQLTGGVAHDFNNLLMAILGSLELVRKRLPGDPAISRFLDNALEAAQRGAALTQRMLAFARRQDLKPVPVDLPALVEGMSGLLHSSLGPMIRIETRFADRLGKVFADPNQLELAILNLAVNARDAMPRGGTVVIEAHPDRLAGMRQNQFVRIAVKDGGMGMDETTLARAMEPFFTTKGVGKGTGLGLSMVHGMTEQLGGKLMLKSREGEGTTVEIWLPAANAADIPDAPQSTADSSSETSKASLTVLAVDDDPLVLLNTVTILEDLGHKVFEAGSGAKALEIMKRERGIDLLITDQAMPNMTGVELAKAIRAEHPDMPVIIATGYAELPADAPGGLKRLSKPFRERDLEDTIRSVI